MAEIPEQKIKALEKKVGSGGKSPRFAQLAGFYLHQGKAKEALRLCDEGLATFPHYSTGHFIKGKALLALKMNAEARREFEIVADFLPANETVSFILSNIQPGEGETLVSPREPAMVRPSTTQVAPAEAAAETAPPSEPETVPAAQETAVPAQPTNIFEAVGQTPEAVEDPFGFGTAGADQAAPPAETATAEGAANHFEGFPGMQEAEGSSPPAETSSASIFDFPFQAQESPAVAAGEESFEAYAERVRSELGGDVNTTTLEEYLNASQYDQASTEQSPEAAPNETIEDLAEKLQSAKKITPVIDLSTKTTIPSSEADTPASTGFVTPTLAEIYAKQGWYDDAIKAYHTLIVTKPAEKERFEKRIAELEDLKKQQG